MNKAIKLGVVGIVFLWSMTFLIHKIEKALNREVLINESILHLSPRNVRSLPPRSNNRNSVGLPRNGKKDGQTYFTPENKRVTITPKGQQIDSVGWTFKFGLAAGIIPPFLGLDFKYAFANKLSLTAGFGQRFDSGNKVISPFAAISYRLDYDVIQNTEIFVGIMALPRNTGIIGVRVNL